MSDLDDLADAIGFDLPNACEQKGPRSALRMRNGRKQLPLRSSHERARRAACLNGSTGSKNRRMPSLPRLKCLEEGEE